MVKLEDAIKHAEEKSGSCECGKEHAQLAKWLKELTAFRATPASAPEGFTMSEPTLLPDGSGFGIMSFPLPKDHWLYKESEYEYGAVEPNDLPSPILTHAHRQQVIAAIRYAVRGATLCGKEDDFDPDALVQNAVYALCGPYSKAAPTPPVSEERKDAERYRWLRAALSDRSAKGRSHHFCSIKEGHPEELDVSIDAAMQENKP